eukprot:CAMPEP_0205923740 /NCGR_PEP_ID=MMETSP1325-20131115/16579_1 /ASSEMBLY_ACC=CAM_ASM_000708 /TAXON_ID=236786 /ORGANISM="Florenciella sp., Strain RCC1007" /LENGTH=58 /DNA_ID=CAMNT_0053292001 /DNA_START=13 /DNA_END=186 /DNA_ORIENTATION=+
MATLVLVACVYTIEYYGNEQASGGPPSYDRHYNTSISWSDVYDDEYAADTGTTSTLCI